MSQQSVRARVRQLKDAENEVRRPTVRACEGEITPLDKI